MTIETEVAALTTAVNALTTTVNVKKATLDASVSTAAISATASSSSASASATSAQTAQGQASLAQGYAASASSVVQQDLSGITAQALHRSPNAITAQFIYDTSKDSDGGAWTEKCQQTSWYNEALAGKWLGPQASELNARFEGATLGSELVTNGNFSSGTGWTVGSGWSISGGTLNYSGAYNASYFTAASNAFVAGKYYRVTMTISGNTSGNVNAYLNVPNNGILNPVNLSGNGEKTFFLLAGVTCNGFHFVGNSATGAMSIDNISVREVTALNTASNDYFQLTTDGKFYRLWRNHLQHSSDFAQSAWQKSNTTTAAATAPDGTSTAVTLTGTGAGATLLRQDTAVSSATVDVSYYVKAGTATTCVIGDVNIGVVGLFNLSSGTVTSGSGATILDAGGGWYRCSITYTAIGGFARQAINPGSTFSGTTTSSIVVWNAQVELGSTATTYEAKTTQGTTSEIFRGNKADFPRLAAIVAENSNVNIYDLTEPGRPMWMRFVSNAQNYAIYGNTNALSMLNGVMALGTSAGYNPVDFAKDSSDIIRIANQGFDRKYPQIALRNAADGALFTNTTKTPIIVNNTVNAVAMTVLPDAPIDPATGLRVPTIAVATSGGVSVIKHNGAVVSTASANSFHHVYIDRNILMYSRIGDRWVAYALNPGSLGASFTQVFMGTNPDEYQSANPLIERFSGRSAPIRFISPTVKRKWNNEALPARGLNMSVAPTFNTGWLTGDIRRAYLSDVTAESISGSELVTNGTFDTDTGWTKAFVTISGGVATPDPAQITCVVEQMGLGLVVGKTYVLRLDLAGRTAGNCYPRAGSFSNLATLTSNGSFYYTFTYTGAVDIVQLIFNSGFNGTVDNISVREVVPDRSYKAQGAILTGTLTKSQLNTGTSLVGYSGFSASNYLREPYSADLDFGTGEFTASAWVNVPVTLPAYSTVALGPELVTNGTFDTSTGWSLGSGWTITGGQLVGTSVVAYSFSSFANTAIIPYRVYKLSFDCTVTSGDLGFGLGNGGQNIDLVSATGSYTRYIVATEASTNAVYFRGNVNFTGTVDNVTLKELIPYSIADRAFSSGPRIRLIVDARGRLTAEAFDGTTTRTVTTTAAYNTATWLKAEANYTTDGSLTIRVNGREVAATRGNPLLSLNSRYNLMDYSENMLLWPNRANITVTDGAIAAPDGTMSMSLVTPTGTAQKTINNKANVPSGTWSGKPISLRFIAKENGYTKILVADSHGNSIPLVTFNLTTGAADNAIGSMTSLGGGFYECRITITSATSPYAYISFSIIPYADGATLDYGGPTFSANGTSGAYIGQVQAQNSTALWSYQKTTTVAVTNVAPLTIGNSYAADAPFPGSIALLKLGATVPTPEQATFMYEQEKQLFRANAQSVLPDAGSVVDMAYDDATDRWVAVSAANESYWTGLVRNTVTPVPAGSYTKIVATSGIELAARSTTNPGVDVTIPAYGLREELVKRAEAAARLGKELVTFDYVGGFTANTTSGNTAITSASTITYPGSYIGARISGSGIPTNATIVAVSGTTLYISAAATATATTVSITFLDFALPAGMEAKVVFNNGVQTREGTTGATFSRLYDGFVETIRFAAAPGATNIVNIQAQRTS